MSSVSVEEGMEGLNSLEERYQYIDSIDLHRNFHVDSLYASMLNDIINDKIEKGDTGDILPLSVSLMNYYYSPLGEPDSIIHLYRRLQAYVERHSSTDIADVIVCLSDAYYAMGKLEKSLDILNRALDVYRIEGDSSYRRYARSYLDAAQTASLLGKYNLAIREYESAKSLFRFQSDTIHLLWASYGQSVLLSKLNLFEKAAELRQYILKNIPRNNAESVVFSTYSAIVADSQHNERYERALNYGRRMIDLLDSLQKFEYYFTAYIGMTRSFIGIGEIDSAYKYFHLLDKRTDTNKLFGIYDIQYNILDAGLAIESGDLHSAQSILKNKLPPVDSIQAEVGKINVLYLQYGIDTSTMNYKGAVQDLQRISLLMDSIHQQIIRNQFTYYQTLFQSSKKKREIAEQDAAIAQLQLEKRKQLILWVIIIGSLILAGGLFYLLKEKRNAEKRHKLQEEFSRKLLNAQEEERKRISRELHDSVGQSLVLIKNKIRLGDDKTTTSLIKRTLDEVRYVSRGLHPYSLEQLGLTEAINHLVREAENNSDIFFDVSLEPIDDLLPIEHELNVYRIIQEALSNVLKHSHAEAAKLIIRKEVKHINVKVIDYGRGFDLTQQKNILTSLGMQTLKERTRISRGKIAISSEKGQGTIIDVSFPYS